MTVNNDRYYNCYTNGDISYKYELHKFPVFSKISDYVMAVHTTKCVCVCVCVCVCLKVRHVSPFFIGHHQATHILYNTQKGLYTLLLSLNWDHMFCKTAFSTFHYKYGLKTIIKIAGKDRSFFEVVSTAGVCMNPICYFLVYMGSDLGRSRWKGTGWAFVMGLVPLLTQNTLP